MPYFKNCLYLLVLLPGLLFAAKSEYLGVDSIYSKPAQIATINPYSINLSSSGSKIQKKDLKGMASDNNELVYLNKIKVNNKTYFRLVMGNYTTQKDANAQLKNIKSDYPSAWINFRTKAEISALSSRLLKSKARVESAAVAKVPTPVVQTVTPSLKRLPASKNVKLAEKLLQDAKQKFLDENYTRVLAIAGKVEEIGNLEQRQQALEYSGIARERQQKIPQAIAIYSEFLALYPNSEQAPKIANRLEGLKTMRAEPKERLAKDKTKNKADDWYLSGSLSQYYRNDTLSIDTLDTEEVNNALVSDINVFARKKTQTDSLVIRFDGGIVNDFLDNDDRTRISRAMVNYINNEGEYQIIGGRQSRTAKGVLGRFDGFVYKDISNPDFGYSLFTGFPVQSSYDSVDTDRVFFGGDISLKFSKEFNMDYYLIQQNSANLTDRQAIGTEFQYRTDRGFLYGIIDYDLFYNDLNNVTAITNYRHNDKLSFNLTIDHRNSPLLTTTNAIQAQGVETLDELKTKTGLSDEQIYQLAEDRTSKSTNLFAGSTYIIDDNSQIYLSLSLSSTEATEASAATATTPAIAAIDAADNVYVAGDYTIRGFFTDKDYTTVGVRVSDTASSETTSIRGRTRIRSSSIKNLIYDPRIRVDFRSSKITNDDQYIINPSFKLSYKPSKKLSLEGSLGLEYSNFDLPNRNDQMFYSVFLGYTYQF